MTKGLIDLTSIQSQVYEDLLKLEFDYDKYRDLRVPLRVKYDEVRNQSEDVFERWYMDIHRESFVQVEKFINKTLAKTMFEDQYSYLVQAATIKLGIQTSDRSYTLDLLEKHVKSCNKSLKVIRINSSMNKRAKTLTLLNEASKVKKLLVIIEQTETMDVHVLDVIVKDLYSMLDSSKRMLILFCLSGSVRPVSLILPDSVKNRINLNAIIVDTSDDPINIQAKLISGFPGLRFYLKPKILECFYEDVLTRDASITNVRYLFQYSLFKHYRCISSVLNLEEKQLVNFLKSNPATINSLKNLKSLADHKLDINWKNPGSIARRCVKEVENLDNNHHRLVDHMDYFLILLKDEVHTVFPTDLCDLYNEVMTYDDLASSSKFYDSVRKIKKYPKESLIRRINRAIEHDSETKLHHILENFRLKIENNEHCDELIEKLINDLLKTAQNLKNPLKMPFCEALYFDRADFIRSKTMPSTRIDIFSKPKSNSYFDIIYSLILNCTEEINAADLFNDFKDIYYELTEEVKKEKKKELQPPKKARKSVRYEEGTKLDAKEVDPDQEGLIKAFFVDVIDSMEHQGLIKRYLTKSKVGIIKRCVWVST